MFEPKTFGRKKVYWVSASNVKKEKLLLGNLDNFKY